MGLSPLVMEELAVCILVLIMRLVPSVSVGILNVESGVDSSTSEVFGGVEVDG